jgi:beta-aspartyl-dipeptidase (metallo-type)
MFHLLKNASVFSPIHLGTQNLLVGAGKLLWMGNEDLALPPALHCEVVDLGGRRLIPGLIDGHVHVTGGGGECGLKTRVPALGLSRYTSAGITTVVGLLGTDDTTRSTADLVAQVLGLREQGMSAYCYAGGYHIPLATLTGSLRGDMVNIDPIIGVGELAISDHRSSQPTLDELLRIAADAHVGGLITGKAGLLHLHLGDGARGLDLVRRALEQSEIPARVFNPTHVNRRKALFEEALELSKRGCGVDVTAFPVADGEDAWSAADAWLRYRDAGCPPERITVSSDSCGCLPTFDAEGRMLHMDIGRPGALLQTIQELLRGGAQLANILPAFTSNVACLLRLPAKGTIAVGADADLVVLDSDSAIHDGMVQGHWHCQNGQQRIAGTFESLESEVQE